MNILDRIHNRMFFNNTGNPSSPEGGSGPRVPVESEADKLKREAAEDTAKKAGEVTKPATAADQLFDVEKESVSQEIKDSGLTGTEEPVTKVDEVGRENMLGDLSPDLSDQTPDVLKTKKQQSGEIDAADTGNAWVLEDSRGKAAKGDLRPKDIEASLAEGLINQKQHDELLDLNHKFWFGKLNNDFDERGPLPAETYARLLRQGDISQENYNELISRRNKALGLDKQQGSPAESSKSMAPENNPDELTGEEAGESEAPAEPAEPEVPQWIVDVRSQPPDAAAEVAISEGDLLQFIVDNENGGESAAEALMKERLRQRGMPDDQIAAYITEVKAEWKNAAVVAEPEPATRQMADVAQEAQSQEDVLEELFHRPQPGEPIITGTDNREATISQNNTGNEANAANAEINFADGMQSFDQLLAARLNNTITEEVFRTRLAALTERVRDDGDEQNRGNRARFLEAINPRLAERDRVISVNRILNATASNQVTDADLRRVTERQIFDDLTNGKPELRRELLARRRVLLANDRTVQNYRRVQDTIDTTVRIQDENDERDKISARLNSATDAAGKAKIQEELDNFDARSQAELHTREVSEVVPQGEALTEASFQGMLNNLRANRGNLPTPVWNALEAGLRARINRIPLQQNLVNAEANEAAVKRGLAEYDRMRVRLRRIGAFARNIGMGLLIGGGLGFAAGGLAAHGLVGGALAGLAGGLGSGMTMTLVTGVQTLFQRRWREWNTEEAKANATIARSNITISNIEEKMNKNSLDDLQAFNEASAFVAANNLGIDNKVMLEAYNKSMDVAGLRKLLGYT